MLKEIKSLLEYSEGKAQISRLAFDLYKKEVVKGAGKKKEKKIGESDMLRGIKKIVESSGPSEGLNKLLYQLKKIEAPGELDRWWSELKYDKNFRNLSDKDLELLKKNVSAKEDKI